MPQPPLRLRTIVWLRLAALLAFPGGAVLMAIYQRGPLSLAVLTAAMLAVSLYERRRLAGVAGVETPVSPASVAMGFAFRLGLLIGLFVLSVGFLALFRDTSLARGLGMIDLGLTGLSAATALAANEISARMARSDFTAVHTEITAAFHPPGSPGAGGDIIDGEIIDPDEPPRAR
ncbi:MAG: hypothetical protein ACK4MQ_00680 [Hyphomonas sp.]